MFRLGFILMAICLVASLVLAATYKFTEPLIEAQNMRAQKSALKAILPNVGDFLEKHKGELVYYECLQDKKVIGFILKARAKGYAGNIDMLVGIDHAGNIQGINILIQQETPGLGSRISEPHFLSQFKGRQAADLKLSNIHAITGATISSRAVLEAVKENVKEFMARI